MNVHTIFMGYVGKQSSSDKAIDNTYSAKRLMREDSVIRIT